MKTFFNKHIAPFLEQIVNQIEPERYTEKNIGNLENYSAVNSGGLLSGTKTEVLVNDSKYLVYGALNGEKKGVDVILRHWPKTQPHGDRYLIINGNKYCISS